METLILGTVQDNPLVVNKNFIIGNTLHGTFRTLSSLSMPTVRVQGVISDIAKFNYCHIPSLNRFYYIEDISMVARNCCDIKLDVDVLMSFADLIKDNVTHKTRIIKIAGDDKVFSNYDNILVSFGG